MELGMRAGWLGCWRGLGCRGEALRGKGGMRNGGNIERSTSNAERPKIVPKVSAAQEGCLAPLMVVFDFFKEIRGKVA